MFGLFKKKKVNTENIQAYKGAIQAVNNFIALSQWENAKKALTEVMQKEKRALEKYVEKKGDEHPNEVKKAFTVFDKKKATIEKLEKKVYILEKRYQEKINQKRFKIHFKTIKKEINSMLNKGQSVEAFSLLKKFLEDNKENTIVIKFYNKEKVKIQKQIEKERKDLHDKFKNDATAEALSLIGEEQIKAKKLEEKQNEQETEQEVGYFGKLKKKLNFWGELSEKKKQKKLLDEINILIEEDSSVKRDIAKQKLELMHRGLTKELTPKGVVGFDIYGKILGAEKISGDTFGFYENSNKYISYLGDATGHGMRAGFIITKFNNFIRNNPQKETKSMVVEMNNSLKQKLETRNFVTGLFFEIDKESGKVEIIGLGHEPILIYRKKQKIVEKMVVGGIAAGIIIIKGEEKLYTKNIELDDGDIIVSYSDGIVEARGLQGGMYSIDKLQETLQIIANKEDELKTIYDTILNDIKLYTGGTKFSDDATILLIKRDFNNNLVKKGDKFLEEIKAKEGLQNKEMKSLRGKTKTEIEKELEKIRRKKQIVSMVKNLESLYYTGEILQLKQSAIRYIKDGYIDKKINFYLQKAIENEKKYKIDQKNQKMESRYKVLEALYKKGDYEAVIQEAENLIANDGTF